jgi:hypothetical protein
LLGPDFHRLDRTSFSWRTYSIGAGSSVGEKSSPIAFAVVRYHDQPELGRLFDGQVGRIRSAQDLYQLPRELPENLSEARTVGKQPAFLRGLWPLTNGRRRNSVVRTKDARRLHHLLAIVGWDFR